MRTCVLYPHIGSLPLSEPEPPDMIYVPKSGQISVIDVQQGPTAEMLPMAGLPPGVYWCIYVYPAAALPSVADDKAMQTPAEAASIVEKKDDNPTSGKI